MEQAAPPADMFSSGGGSNGQDGSIDRPGLNSIHEELYGCATASQSVACGRRGCGDVRDSDER